MIQPSLFAERPVRGLCSFGETGEGWDGPHHCAKCNEWMEEGCREFDAAVARGEYNRRGYTRREWKAAGYDDAAWASAPGWNTKG